MSDFYTCRRLKLLDFLQKRGFEVVDSVPDIYNPKFRCWRFYRTQELMDAVDAYYAELNKN